MTFGSRLSFHLGVRGSNSCCHTCVTNTLTCWIILPSLNGLLEFKIEIIIVKFVCLVYVYVCMCIWRGTFACAYMFRGQKLTMCVFLSTLHLI